jgi:hypothetical protein
MLIVDLADELVFWLVNDSKIKLVESRFAIKIMLETYFVEN